MTNKYTVTKTLKTRVMNSLTVKQEDSPTWFIKNKYLTSMLQQKEILCSQCAKVLSIGDLFTRNVKTNRKTVRYICMKCDKRRWY